MNENKINENARQWWHEPLAIGALQTESGLPSLEVARRWKELGFNTEQLLHPFAQGYFAFYDEEVHRETLRLYLSEAKTLGLRVILYLNTHCIPTQWLTSRPEYFARDRNGEILQAYNQHYAFVDVASPWREYALRCAQTAVSEGVDGIFSDGPVATNSWSHSSAEAFYSLYKQPLEELGDSIEESVLKANFNREIGRQFTRDLSTTIKKTNSECLFYSNLDLHVSPGDTLEVQDFVASEGGFGYYGHPRESKAWKAGFTSRVLEGWASGSTPQNTPIKPRVNFICADQKMWNRTFKPGPDILRQAANAAQHGSNYWIGVHSDAADLDRAEMQDVAQLNRIVTAHPAVFGASCSLAKVALYWSFESLAQGPQSQASDFYTTSSGRGEIVAGHESEMQGWCRALIASHIPFDVLSSGLTSAEILARYEVLVLPAVCVLSRDEVSLFTQWMKDGGRLIVSADAGRLDEASTLLERPALDELLGIETSGEIEQRGACNYMTMNEDAASLLAVAPCELLPDWTRAVSVTAREASTLARFYEPVIGQYHPPSPLAGAAITHRKMDRGEAIFFAGDIGQTYGDFGLPALRKLMKNSVQSGRQASVTIENAPGFLEVSVRQSCDKKLIAVHLVNHGGDFEQPLETPVSLHDLRIKLPTEYSFSSVRTLVSGRELEMENEDDCVRVTLPKMGVYEVLTFE